MEGAVIFGLGLLAAGLFFCWLAWRLWTYRDGGLVNLLEAAILKATGEEPLPSTKFDHWLHHFQMVMSGFFGMLLTAVSIYGLLEEAGLI